MSHYLGRTVYWRLSAWYFFYFAFIGAFASYFSLYLRALNFDPWAISVLMSLMQAMRLLAPTVWGWLADRSGRPLLVLRISALFSALGFLLFFIAKEFSGMVAAMALLTFFWSAALPLAEALTLDHLAGQVERYGRIRLWGSIGFIVAVLGTGIWLNTAPLADLLWICIALLAGILIAAWSLPRADRQFFRPSVSLQTILIRREVLALLAACFFMSAAHGPLYVFLSIYLVDQGYDKIAVGAMWSLGVIAEIFVFLAMPRLMRYWALRTILAGSFVFAVIRFLLIAWLPDVLFVMIFAQLMHGVTFGAYHASAIAALNRWFSSGQQARAQAIYGSISFGAGGMVGGLMAGRAWEAMSPALTYSLGSLCALIGLFILWRGMAPATEG